MRVVQGLADNTLPTTHIYSFLQEMGAQYFNVSAIQHMFLGMDLLQPNNIFLTIACAVLLFAQTTITTWVQPKPTTTQKLPNGQEMPDMSKMMPLMNIMMVVMMGSFVYSVKS